MERVNQSKIGRLRGQLKTLTAGKETRNEDKMAENLQIIQQKKQVKIRYFLDK